MLDFESAKTDTLSMKTVTQRKAPCVLFGFFLLGIVLFAQSSLAADENKPEKLFANDDEWKVTLTAPWREIQRYSSKDANYPAQFTYPGENGELITVDVEVAPRALTRRRICDFPPLKVFFDKKEMKGTELRGNKSLKLVTYCGVNTKYEQYYIKEYLVYRIYNLITDLSFRAKPMVIDYKDSKRDAKPLTRFGFLIEDIDDVAKRNDLEKLTVGQIPYKQLDRQQTAYFGLFQYMVGNLDWAATGGPNKEKCCHNAKVIGKGENEIPKYAIPYDFDSTGLVNAHYAAPPEALKVKSVRHRLYRGFCVSNPDLPQAVSLFQLKKPEIMALFTQNPHLNAKNQKRAVKYLEDFYEVLDDPKRFKREITDKCRGKAAQ
jgi:hypothetical protein